MSETPNESTPPAGRGTLAAYGVALLGVGAVTAALAPFSHRLSPTAVALALLLVVLFVATARGMRPAMAASVAGVLAFNFFFLPPFGTLHVENPQNWVALAAFLVTAVTAGQLSARARRRAEEAELARAESEGLYAQLREAFDRASRAEALRQSEQMKTALLDAVTHDLRTPLTSIKVSVTTLLDELRDPAGGDRVPLAPEERAELLEVIDEETDRLDRFVGNLVELARIEAGAMQLRRRPTGIGEIVAQALGRSERHAKTHPASVRIDDGLPSVRGDGRALAEVLNTLVDNAAKYSPHGSPVELSARADGDGVLIAVEDRGPGIPEGLRERVFQKFFRFVPEESPAGGQPPGTGMGLSIARGIVEAHGGRIWVEAGAGGEGTRACVWLPAAGAGP